MKALQGSHGFVAAFLTLNLFILEVGFKSLLKVAKVAYPVESINAERFTLISALREHNE